MFETKTVRNRQKYCVLFAERKVLKTFSKFQKTPPMRRHKKSPTGISEDDTECGMDPKMYLNHCHLDKDSLQTNVSTVGNL